MLTTIRRGEKELLFALRLLYFCSWKFPHEIISLFYFLGLFRVKMASDDIAQLTDALEKTHVGDEHLSFQALGLKLDDAASGQKIKNPAVAMSGPLLLFMCVYTYVYVLLVEELVREIQQHPCLRALCLEGNTVGVDAARAIAKALESKEMLQVLISSY